MFRKLFTTAASVCFPIFLRKKRTSFVHLSGYWSIYDSCFMLLLCCPENKSSVADGAPLQDGFGNLGMIHVNCSEPSFGGLMFCRPSVAEK